MSVDGRAPVPVAPFDRLRLPDEPTGRREQWRTAVLDGTELSDVVGGHDGVAGWLWTRWPTLGAHGMDRAAFSAVVVGYRRELWLWLAGDRTWEQCGTGLIGRIGRRLAVRTS